MQVNIASLSLLMRSYVFRHWNVNSWAGPQNIQGKRNSKNKKNNNKLKVITNCMLQFLSL